MEPEKNVISWKEITSLQREGIPVHIVFLVGNCENCGHSLDRHYKYNPSPKHGMESAGHAVQRMMCSWGRCICPGIKIQGKVIDNIEDILEQPSRQ